MNILITIAVVIISTMIFVILMMMMFGALANRYQKNKTMKKKIYIAGKVSGMRFHECSLKFGVAQNKLQAQGYEVVNPLEVVGDFNAEWIPAMKLCLIAMLSCDEVYFLKDWKMSRGAVLENTIAKQLQIPMTFESYNTTKS